MKKNILKKIKHTTPEISENEIKQMFDKLIERFDKVDNNLDKIYAGTSLILASINEQEIENNVEDKLKAEQLFTEIMNRVDKLEPEKKREIGSNFNADLSAAGKLKLTIPLIPMILSYEAEFSLSSKVPIKTWKDAWKAFVKPK